MAPDFFTHEALQELTERFQDQFHRYEFLRKFMDGIEGTWQEANLLMAIMLGFR